MIDIVVTEEFIKRYCDLPLLIQKKAEKQERFFRENPFHTSLHTEKLESKSSALWSFRIDKHYRILFRFINGKKALFLTVGTHDWIYKIPA